MIQQNRLTMAEAEIAVDAALAEAARLGIGSVICVSDAAGYPIVIKRPDHGKVTSIMNMHGGRFAIFVGGWPIEVDGEVVGGIGVSGGHTPQDIACCKAGITALLEHLGKPVDFSKWDDWKPPV